MLRGKFGENIIEEICAHSSCLKKNGFAEALIHDRRNEK